MWGANGIQKSSLLPPWSWNPPRADCRSGRYKKPATGWSHVRKYWGNGILIFFSQEKLQTLFLGRTGLPCLKMVHCITQTRLNSSNMCGLPSRSARCPFLTSGGGDSWQSQVSEQHGAAGVRRQLSEVAETRVKTQSALCFCLPKKLPWDCPSFLSPAD